MGNKGAGEKLLGKIIEKPEKEKEVLKLFKKFDADQSGKIFFCHPTYIFSSQL
jgi:Ca2+-binding EF-hand superfamily protein